MFKIKIMKCEDFEMEIVLYTELSSGESNLLHQHLESCPNCQKLFLEMKKVQKSIELVAIEKSSIRNAANLTHKVMERIALEKQERTIFEVFFEFLQDKSIKYTFASASFILVIVFATQFFSASWQPEKIQSNRASVILNSTAFRKTFSQRKVNRRLFTECVSPFRSNQNYLLCLKSKMK